MTKDPICGMTVDEATAITTPEAIRELHALGLKVLRLAAQPDHCRRSDEPEFRFSHQQRLAAAEGEVVI